MKSRATTWGGECARVGLAFRKDGGERLKVVVAQLVSVGGDVPACAACQKSGTRGWGSDGEEFLESGAARIEHWGERHWGGERAAGQGDLTTLGASLT